MGEHFFIVGAQRCGTTYLYRILDEHPDIEMAKPIRPEPKFFHIDPLFEKGLAFYRNHYFDNYSAARLFGEKSTTYFESEKAARRIANCFPQAKILVILRDPVERAVSNYWFSVNNGWETLPMNEAFLGEEQRQSDYDAGQISVSPYAYLGRGRYIDYLLMYERFFPPENVKVLLFEQLVGSQVQINLLYTYLGVTKFTPTVLHTSVNTGPRPNVPLASELRRYLVDYFAGPNAQLEKHLNISLKDWWQ
jgi:hypothetical protein